MSVSKWAYDPNKCEGQMCVGDCDICSKKDELSEEYIRDACDFLNWLASVAKGVDNE